jgi:quercetin dioxygenase-like cupin family protein
MTMHARVSRSIGMGIVLALIGSPRAHHEAFAQTSAGAAPDTSPRPARVAFTQALPALDGRHLKATIVEVRYGPGESSPAHSHPCAVIGYVIAGALRNQVAGEPVRLYHAGESFYEAPNGVHAISANASPTDSVRFLAYFTCDRDTPLSVPPPGGHH